MKIVGTETTAIHFDQEGDAYFYVGEMVHYLSDFMSCGGQFDAVDHLTNAGGIGINLDATNEEVEYSIFTD